jgi:hypothetical protein
MTDEAMSPLRRRMIEDMTIRKFAPKSDSPSRRPGYPSYRSISAARRRFRPSRSAGGALIRFADQRESRGVPVSSRLATHAFIR